MTTKTIRGTFHKSPRKADRSTSVSCRTNLWGFNIGHTREVQASAASISDSLRNRRYVHEYMLSANEMLQNGTSKIRQTS